MTPVALFLVTIASIFLIGALGEIVFKRTGVPDVIWLLVAGIVFGPVTGTVTAEDLGAIAPFFGAFALVVVLFNGGTQLDLPQIMRAAPRSSVLAVLTFGLTAALVAVATMPLRAIGWLPPEWTWGHAALLGMILGGSSSIVVMPAMALAGIEKRTESLINLESAFTDAFSVIGAVAMIQILLASADVQVSAGEALAKSFGLGASLGLVAGFGWLVVLRALHSSEHGYPVTLAALLLLYVGVDSVGGSAALAILAFAIVVGNAEHFKGVLRLEEDFILSADVRGFHRQITFIVKSFFFTFVGAMLSPPWSLVAIGVGFGVLLLVARVPAVWLALKGGGFDSASFRIVSISMPRGLAAGVMATMPMAAGVPGTSQLPVLVFAAVITTIVLFTVGLPLAKREPPGLV